MSLDNILKQVGDLVQAFVALPAQASRVLAQVESGGLMVQSPQMSRELRSITRSVDRLTGGILFVGLLIGGVMLYNAGNVMYGQGLLGAALIALVWVLFARKEK